MDAKPTERDDSVTVASPLDRERDSMLPGLAVEVMPVPLSEEEAERLPEHTAARLLELHPDRYALATALFFGSTLSGREICRIARVGSHTLQHIIEREERGRTAAQWAQSAGARLRSLADLGMAAAADLLCDQAAIREAGIKGVATLIRESTHAHALLEGRLPGQSNKPSDPAAEYLAQMSAAQRESIEVGEESGSRVGYDAAEVGASEGDDHVQRD